MAGSSKYKEGRLILLGLEANDEYATSYGTSSTTSTSFQDKCTLTFTPHSACDYLIMAYAAVQHQTILKYMTIQLYDSGTATAYGSRDHCDNASTANNWEPWFTAVKLNLAASSQTFKIQYLAQSGITAAIRESAIVALRMDYFANQADTYYAEALSDSFTTSDTTYQDKAMLTYTPEEATHLILSSSYAWRGSTSANSDAKVIDTSGDRVYQQHQASLTTNHSTWPITDMKKEDLSGASETWKTQYKKSSTGLGVAHMSDSTITVIDLSERRIV